jgi:antitoxin (DNA-binding transcriptional repressor) of toxin-antitoxin stability system
MRMQSKAQQIDVTKSRETLAELVRRLGRFGQPVELVEGGRVVARVVPTAAEAVAVRIVAVPEKEQAAATKRLLKIQQKVGRMMKRTGKTEEGLMRVLLEDD